MKEKVLDNIIYKIGSNAKENWNLLSSSKATYMFFHLSSFPSCFVILECEDTPSNDIIQQLASECKNNTKYKNVPNVKVDYTLCSNVEKGETVGEVYYKNNKKVKQIKI